MLGEHNLLSPSGRTSPNDNLSEGILRDFKG